MKDSDVPAGVADLRPLDQAREQKAWYWYDWANSAYVTTIATVLLAPYLIAIAEEAAVDDRISVLGLSVAPGSLPSYLVTFSTILSALILPPLGAMMDRTEKKKQWLAGFAWTGAALRLAAVVRPRGELADRRGRRHRRQPVPGGARWSSTTRSCRSSPTRPTATGCPRAAGPSATSAAACCSPSTSRSSRCLPFGLTTGEAARICMLSAAIWWAGFTIIPFVRLSNHPPANVEPAEGNVVARSFGQLVATLRDMRNYPMALTFLLAYLFFNDGIQTVIASSSTYGSEELGHGQSVLIGTILLVQFVAFFGALLFGRLAQRQGAKKTILMGLVIWMVIVTAALFLPAGNVALFMVFGVAVGIVLGGTQALARSYFSLLIPRGKEAEYFSFYHAMDRGTSWFGTLVFGLTFQFTGSYRPAVFALIVFFLVGGYLLTRVDTERGIRDAGNALPAVV